MNLKQIQTDIRLSLGEGIGPSLYCLLVNSFGSSENVFLASELDFVQKGFSSKVYPVIQSIPHYQSKLLESLLDKGMHFVSFQSLDYPQLLKEIHSFPPFLFVRGSLAALHNKNSIGIVGSRESTPYGQVIASQLAQGLSAQGCTVISGFALGIDICAHRACFENGYQTVAVMAHGLDQIAPYSHKKYETPLLDAKGAFVSEFLPGVPPMPKYFPKRNRIVSGLSRGVIVVQAKAKSGALITAYCALDQNRDVFAVPGDIQSELSAGPHSLIKRGAKLIETAIDVLDEWNYELQTSLPLEQAKLPLLLDLINKGSHTIDQLVGDSKLPVEKILLELTQYELAGRLTLMPGGIYRLL